MRDEIIDRLINTWGGNIEELFALVQMINRIRQRAIRTEYARILALAEAIESGTYTTTRTVAQVLRAEVQTSLSSS
jgi:ATP-dependent protease ClpP protease subunit